MAYGLEGFKRDLKDKFDINFPTEIEAVKSDLKNSDDKKWKWLATQNHDIFGFEELEG